MKQLYTLAIIGIILAIIGIFPASAQGVWCDGYCVEDPVNQVHNLRHRPEALGFRIGSWDYDLGGADHVQGIARYNAADGTPYLFITTSRDDGAELVIAEMASRDTSGERMRSNRLLWNTDTDDTPAPASDVVMEVYHFPGWKHAGGIAVIEHYLIVPLENGKDWNTNPNGARKIGTFAIYDIQNPTDPWLVYEHSAWDESMEETKIGVAGITREPDGRYLVLLGVTRGGTSNKEVKFLRSTTTELETSAFELVNIQHPDGDGQFATTADSNVVTDTTYQNFNFVRDCDDGTLYLIATYSTSVVPLGGDDKVHMFRVNYDAGTDTYTIDDDNRLLEDYFNCKTYDSEKHCDFIAAAGTYISPSGELILYAATHYMNTDGGVDEIPVAEFRYRDVAIPSSPLWRPQAILPESHYEANEGESIFFDGTGSKPTFIKGWLDLYEDEGYTDSMITLDWDDRTLENWAVLYQIDGFDDEADSIRFYTPCPATLRLYTENNYAGDYIQTPCGLGAISSLDAYDVGDDIESVLFNGVAFNILAMWEWDFGAGYSEGSLGETHTYGDDGDYWVFLRVTEQDGDADETGAAVTVLNVAPTVAKGAMDQPNPEFILPLVHTLTFNATFSDPGWLDTHTALWSFGDGTNDAGTLIEENDEPDATGTVTGSHAYAAPGDYTVTVTVTDDDGGAATSDAWTVHVADVEEATHVMADYIQNLPDGAFKKHADQRKAAFANMFCAMDDMIAEEEWNGFTTSLQSNVRSKADGQIDGKAGDDWITDADAQQHICMKVDDITAYVVTF